MTPPRDNLYRFSAPGAGLGLAAAERAADASAEEMPTLSGHFAVFNQWTEINSMWEGTFLERISPGAFKKTFRENRDSMRVLFQHGRDPQVGDKPLGPISDLREQAEGAYYEVPLLATAYNRELVPGLEAGLYGASFRFQVMRDEMVEEPAASAYNPKGLPERTIKEARVMEFGPVTFPAYAAATAELAGAGMRSLTDVIRDVDAVQGAAAILLDDLRLAHVQAFVSRAAAPPATFDTAPPADPGEEDAAPPDHDAEPAKAHLSLGRRGDHEAADKWWLDRDQRRTPSWAR